LLKPEGKHRRRQPLRGIGQLDLECRMTEMDERLITAAVQRLVVKYWNDVGKLAAVKAQQVSAEKDRANA
jgi:hypothetical protein